MSNVFLVKILGNDKDEHCSGLSPSISSMSKYRPSWTGALWNHPSWYRQVGLEEGHVYFTLQRSLSSAFECSILCSCWSLQRLSFHGSSSCALTHHLRGQGHASRKVGLIYLKLYHILCSMDEIDIAYREAMQGRASSRPIIEMTIPSVLDRTIAPPG